MKKLLTLTAVGAIMAASANAATQCVYKPSTLSQNCTAQVLGEAEWEITCGEFTYRGVAMWTYLTSGDARYDILPDAYFSWGDSSSVEGKETYVICYCKMIYPVESKWIRRDASMPQGNSGGAWVDALGNIDSCAFYCLDDQGVGDSSYFARSVNAYLSNLKE